VGLIPEGYEVAHRVSALKVVALVVNLAVVSYLLYAKRLFGLRGGGRAEHAERERDNGLAALERTLRVTTAGRPRPDTTCRQPLASPAASTTPGRFTHSG
jgi:hypothetical protein